MHLRLVTDQNDHGWWAVYINDRIRISESTLDRFEAERDKEKLEDCMETAICKNCSSPIVREGAGATWKHYPSMMDDCAPAPKAEPKTDDLGNVIPAITTQIH